MVKLVSLYTHRLDVCKQMEKIALFTRNLEVECGHTTAVIVLLVSHLFFNREVKRTSHIPASDY